MATLSGSKLVCLNSAAGSPKLDLAMTLDIQATAEQYSFAAKMRNQTIEQLKSLETWVERQATGLDMAANPDSLRSSFDKLLKVIRLATTTLICIQCGGGTSSQVVVCCSFKSPGLYAYSQFCLLSAPVL